MPTIEKRDIISYSDWLPNQYKDSTNLRILLSIFLSQVQELEDQNVLLDQVSTDIQLAYGYQLDIIGKLLGEYRKSRSDGEYRDAILFRISINIGNGTPENAIQYLSYVTSANKVFYWEHYPASVILETNGEIIPNSIARNVDNMLSAGVSLGGIIDSSIGIVFRPCELINAYDNYGTIYPELLDNEFGGIDMEMGNEAAEFSNAFSSFFSPVGDGDILSGCILPEINIILNPTLNGAGEPLMQCGEPAALCGDNSIDYATNRGIFSEVYTIGN